MVGSVVTLIILEVASLFLIDRLAEESALDHAADHASEAANVALAPYLTDAFFDGEPRAVQALTDAGAVLVASPDVVHLKIWSSDGTVLWADDPNLIGRTFELDAEELELFGTHGGTAAVSDLTNPENEFDATGGGGRLLEAYFATETVSGRPILVEVYAPYDLVSSRAADLRSSFLPLMSIVLIVLAIGQIALVWSLGRRLARSERRQARLLRRLINTSDAERRRVASEVHDGVVQDLAGISFSLAAVGQGDSPESKTVRQLAEATQDAVGSLRGLLSSIYPVTVPAEGWVAGLADLIDGLRRLGVGVTVDVVETRLSEIEELLLLHVTREALRNVAAHAAATEVVIRLVEDRHRLVLTVADDGRGFDPTTDFEGHFGLKLMSDLVGDAGGTLETDSAPGFGTTLRCDLAVTR